jgi:sorbitol-specific phosphotransferase system component IIBC
MKLNLGTVLAALPSLSPYLTAGTAVAKLVGEIVDTFHDRPTDQATLKEAIDDLAADNDEGHARYQAKLDAAIKAGG